MDSPCLYICEKEKKNKRRGTRDWKGRGRRGMRERGNGNRERRVGVFFFFIKEVIFLFLLESKAMHVSD
jgi:hypothetical protein